MGIFNPIAAVTASAVIVSTAFLMGCQALDQDEKFLLDYVKAANDNTPIDLGFTTVTKLELTSTALTYTNQIPLMSCQAMRGFSQRHLKTMKADIIASWKVGLNQPVTTADGQVDSVADGTRQTELAAFKIIKKTQRSVVFEYVADSLNTSIHCITQEINSDELPVQ